MRRALLLGLCGLAVLVAGCGRVVTTKIRGGAVTVYASSPLNGPKGAFGRDLVTGEKLALGVAKARSGMLLVKLVSYDAARRAPSGFNRAAVLSNAQNALDDSSTIAYIGEATRGGTRTSMAVVSSGSIAVVSPSDDDPQLTSMTRRAQAASDVALGRSGYSLAALTDAQALALAGPVFRKAYRHDLGGTPNATEARGYDAMRVILDAVGRSGERADRVRFDGLLWQAVHSATRRVAGR